MATWPAKINYATGDVLTAAQMNDIGGELNDLYTASGAAAGKNKIINGDFGIWQRGTTVNLTTNVDAFLADRWAFSSSFSAGTSVYSRQTFTPGTAPVSGYEGQYYARLTAGTTSNYAYFRQKVEDVRTFAGKTITFSFWAKASGTGNISSAFYQNFGSGGSASVLTSGMSATALSTSWTRYSASITLPSVSGKTIGTSSYLDVYIEWAGTLGSQTLDIWGVQLEAGLTATPFQTATGTIQGELAACQRYLPAVLVGSGNSLTGYGTSTTNSYVCAQFAVQARTAPTGISVSGTSYTLYAGGGGSGTPTAIAFDSAGVNSALIQVTTTAGSPTLAANNAVALRSTASGSQILFTGCEL